MKQAVRSIMRLVAKGLNKLTGGHLHPNAVTAIGLLAFFPIGLYLIPEGQLVLAGILTLVFGLMDTLDGELARLQNRTSEMGMFLDSVSDRMKEILLYVGLGIYITQNSGTDLQLLPWNVAALGIAILVSYINAWGEVAIAKAGKQPAKVNSALRGGLASYEVRMVLIAIGLLFWQWLMPVLIAIVVLGAITVLDRSLRVIKQLR